MSLIDGMMKPLPEWRKRIRGSKTGGRRAGLGRVPKSSHEEMMII
jgi:hypothetical protein